MTRLVKASKIVVIGALALWIVPALFTAEIDAFRNQPVERVMQRLGERLKGVTIEIQPFRNDGSPTRVQLENVGGGK